MDDYYPIQILGQTFLANGCTGALERKAREHQSTEVAELLTVE